MRIIDLAGSCRLIIGLQQDAGLRASFNDLAKQIFRLDFEDWYGLGLWKDQYIPYAIVDGDRVIANVSVSPQEYALGGKMIRLVQLGTVMTHPEHRGRGWIRQLMARVLEDWADDCDGLLLYANDSVVDLYPRFGFQRAKETVWSKPVNHQGPLTARRMDPALSSTRTALERMVEGQTPQSALELAEPLPLLLFYLTKFMREALWFLPQLDAWVIAEIEGTELLLHQVISRKRVDLDQVSRCFGPVTNMTLGFTPLERAGYIANPLKESNTTLFVRGRGPNEILASGFRIPSLART